MSFRERSDLVVPALRVLRTAIDTGDGGTPEQRRLLEVLATAVWGFPDGDPDRFAPITSAEAAARFDDAVASLRLQQLLVLAELLRHPRTGEQVERVESFAVPLGGDDEGLRLVRGLVLDEAERAVAHFNDVWRRAREDVSDRSVRLRYDAIDVEIDDPELATRMREMADLPRGTLGREYLEFYLANEFALPGAGVRNPAFFVQHDLGHLVAGFPPTAEGELALSAFQLGMCDDDAHWTQFLANLAVYEIGVEVFGPNVVPRTGVLRRAGVFDQFLAAYLRGTRCTGNYNAVGLLHRAASPVDEIRADFGVEPPAAPFPERTGP